MLQLYAVCDPFPMALPVAPGANRFEDLYTEVQPGVYTALRTFDQYRFLALEHHLQRTADSIARLGWDYQFDQQRMRRALDHICRQGEGERRIRIDVLAAPASAYASASRELIACMPFTPPPDHLYTRGALTATCTAIHRDDPRAKTAEFSLRRQAFASKDAAIQEQLLVDAGGNLLEGFSSNFYAVRDGRLYTAGEGVLEGTVRTIVLELAARAGLQVVLEAVPLADLDECQEAAISSSSRGLMPVVRIDDRTIGDGRPGPIIQALMRAYRRYIAGAIKPAV